MKQQFVDLALNGSGIRDTARVLYISTGTVLKELKKRINTATSECSSPKATEPPKTVKVKMGLVKLTEEVDERETELDEMWSYACKKSNPRWLWHG